MEHFPSNALIYKNCENAMEEWGRVKKVLKANPRLMTPRALLLSLHNKPPLQVVEYMLSLNPQAASIPKKGPTALQVAVQYHSSVDVIICLLRACPFALLASSLDGSNFKDPLDCATKLRPGEADLIRVLSQPLSYWLDESHKQRLEKEQAENRRKKESQTNSEKKELEKVKLVAASTFKAQLNQMQALEAMRSEMKTAELSRSAILEEVDQHQKKNLKAQLIALDMKEKELRKRHLAMERRIIRSWEDAKQMDDCRHDAMLMRLESTVYDFERAVSEWKNHADDRIRRLESQLGLAQEKRLNELYCIDTHPQLEPMDLSANEPHGEPSSTPFVFAIPFSNDDDEEDFDADEPLFPKASIKVRRAGFWHSKRNRITWLPRIRTPRHEYKYMEK